jgi:hypothetical protein
MARLSHPNVVAVHDAGVDDGRVFIAMDYIDGTTLSRWLKTEPRNWRDVVRMFVQAGRGLAAAHAAGLVHRDFKPENVLIDESGVARVMDFGLVRPLDESVADDELDATPGERLEALAALRRAGDAGTLADDSLTKTGAILGTPAYMAPEQGHGKAADPRSDQFSFCVALFEGLHGHRPYEGGSAADLLATSEEEELLSTKRRSDVPPRIYSAIRRGLRTQPDRRWPSMGALLDELERTRFNISVGSVLGIAAATVVVVAAAVNIDTLRAWWDPVTLTIPVDEAALVEPMGLHTSPGGEPYVVSTVANKGRLELNVEIPTSGRYYLHGLVWEQKLGGDRGDADSFFVYVDGGEEKLWHFGCQNEVSPEHVLIDNWAWQPVLHMANADSDCDILPEFSWDLKAGPHRIIIRNREDAPSPELAARLARVVVTNQADWRP